MAWSVEIKEYHAVASWTWGAGEDGDVCSICRAPFDGCPPDCKVSSTLSLQLGLLQSCGCHINSHEAASIPDVPNEKASVICHLTYCSQDIVRTW